MSREYACDHCGKKEVGPDGKMPNKWDWQIIELNKEYRGKTFTLCPECQKELYLRRAKVKEEFLLETIED